MVKIENGKHLKKEGCFEENTEVNEEVSKGLQFI
jgi:hypothetical protein